MFQDGGDVEPLDERAAVIASRHNAVVFELNQRLLDGNPADPRPCAISLRSTRSPLRSLPVNSRLRMWATTWSFP